MTTNEHNHHEHHIAPVAAKRSLSMVYVRINANSDVFVCLGPGGVAVYFALYRTVANAAHEQTVKPCAPAGQKLESRFCLSFPAAIDLLRLAETRGYRVPADCYTRLAADAAAERGKNEDV